MPRTFNRKLDIHVYKTETGSLPHTFKKKQLYSKCFQELDLMSKTFEIIGQTLKYGHRQWLQK